MTKQKQRNKIFRIEGQVLNRKDQKGVPGLRVETWDKDEKYDDLLGSTTTDAKGYFLLEFDEAIFKDSCGDQLPDVYFKIYSGGTLIKSTEDSVICNLASQETKIIMEVDIDMLVTVEDDRFKVSGKIITDQGTAARGLKVIAIDKNPGKDVVLGEAITDTIGNYAIFYTIEVLQKTGKQQADIEIKVVNPMDESKIYGTSAVHYNAAKDEKINLVLQSEILDKPPEFQQITADLTPYIKEGSFKDLQENEERQDISYLANKTGWDARLVAMVSLADKYSHENNIPAQFYYALFRAGVPTDPDGLYRVNIETVGKTWEKAVDQNIIHASFKENIPQNLTSFKEYSTTHLLEKANPVGVSSLKNLLDISLAEAPNQKEFTALYYHHKGDMKSFWKQAQDKFGNEITAQLQLDGKIAYLTLDNAPLIKQLRDNNLIQNDPVDLVRNGFYKPESWENAPGVELQVPDDMPGETNEDKKKNYIDFMAFQLKRSYPTAVVAEMVKNNELPLGDDVEVKNAVYQFFRDTQGTFEIGGHPVEQFLKDNNLVLEQAVLKEVKKLQRVYQVSPSDRAMEVLMSNNLDSAYSIVQYGEKDFMGKFAGALGVEKIAKMTYNKAHKVYSTVLNIAASYLTYRANPALYAISGHKNEKSVKPLDAVSGDVGIGLNDSEPVVYPTLEGLFGSMDFCDCDHCRSVLSPAAYLVDLLEFINLKEDIIEEGENPLEALLTRRPDIEHIQLTCENTNTVLPYIDLVNEILEYYTVHPDKSDPENTIKNTIDGFEGYNIEENITTEELLANPQFVSNEAYELLKDRVYPFNLPFNYHLESLGLYYHHLKVPLYEAMEKLRVNDELDAWRDVYNEYLGISPQEYEVLTNSEVPNLNLPVYYGRDENMTIQDFIRELSNAKEFSRTTNIAYEELIEITKTQFINPNAHLIPKLEKLTVSFTDIMTYQNNYQDPNFINQIPSDLDLSKYDGNVAVWLQDNYEGIMHLILLRDFSSQDEVCGFDNVELRYSLPDDENNYLEEIEFWRLLRFIRLWRKLGWTIAETDKTITALYKNEFKPDASDSPETKKTKLDNGFKDLLIKIAHVKKIMEELNLGRKKSLIKLLALWSHIDTHGNDSLYQQMFLHSTILKIDDVFKEDGYGGYLQNGGEEIRRHKMAFQAAFNITGEELSLILEHTGFDDNTSLSLENVSEIFRYGFLARVLKLSIQELITLKIMSGIDSFNELAYVDPGDPQKYKQPGILVFIERVQLIKQSGFKIPTLGYFLLHEDVTGKASPCRDDILAFAKTLKDGLVRINREHQVEDDPTGEITKAKMALVYENDVVDKFFGFLTGTTGYWVFSVEYTHHQEELEESLKVNERISYFHTENRLSYQGIMTEAERDDFIDAADAAGAAIEFKDAVNQLYNKGQDFFNEFPFLAGLYNDFTVSSDPNTKKFKRILAALLPDLKKKLKHLFIKQALGAVANIDPAVLGELLENKDVIHSVGSTDEPAMQDFLQLEENGGLDSQFYLEVPDNESYTFFIEMSANLDPNAGEGITLLIDGNEIDLDVTGQMWKNTESVELTAGKLYLFKVEITGAADIASLKWQRTGMEKESIPMKYVYPDEKVQNFNSTYLRVLKAAALLEGLELNEKETRFFSTHIDYYVDGKGFLNAVPVTANPDANIVSALFDQLIELFRFTRLKESLQIKDQSLVTIFADPAAEDENGESLLLEVTGWDESSKNELLTRFNWSQANLSDLEKFQRVNNAFEIVNKVGVPVVDLLDWTTNQPVLEIVRDIQGSFKAKYDEEGWLEVLQPINDELRDRRRDALVSHVLHQMQKSGDGELEKIDTPDKLFEYFLVDVEMESCMKTSRIKQAISTVQLFIQRCLMNLEPAVSAASIKKGQWEWMKRYRVWEANRKIFLYPENWLEPELRDNKSPFFRDLESELLQADINDELAETAFLNYLEKLDEVAKLEICGMYIQENEAGNEYDDILHVFGRTAGASRKYYYRRFDGTWTPWEKVDLDIEDNPILPVVWNNRLFLFWLNIVKKGPDGKPLPQGKDASKLKTDDLNTPVKQSVEVNLSWSEYYNNKWQPRKTSDFDKPINFGEFMPDEFDRKCVTLSLYKGNSEKLIIKISDYLNNKKRCLQLHNKHSLPGVYECFYTVGSGFRRDAHFIYEPFNDIRKFLIKYCDENDTFVHRLMVSQYPTLYTIKPNHNVENIFEAPFFYQDAKHVFFVKPGESWETVNNHDFFGIQVPFYGSDIQFDIPHLYTNPDIYKKWITEPPPEVIIMGAGPDPVTINYQDTGNFLNKVVSDPGTVSFNNVTIGAMGSEFAANLYNSAMADGEYEMALIKGYTF